MDLQNKSLTAQLEYVQTSSLPTAVARVAEDSSNLIKALSTAQGATIAQTMSDLKAVERELMRRPTAQVRAGWSLG